MKWLKVSDEESRSHCGDYSVKRVIYAGTFFYEAWHGRTFLQRREDEDGDRMRKVCAEHKAKAATGALELHENGDGC